MVLLPLKIHSDTYFHTFANTAKERYNHSDDKTGQKQQLVNSIFQLHFPAPA